jgi:hypothetical protein
MSVYKLTNIELEDALRPSKSDMQRLLAESLAFGSSYAEATGDNGELVSECLNFKAVLDHIPAFLNSRSPGDPLKCKLKHSEYEASRKLWVTGKSTWRTKNDQCNLSRKILSQKLLLGVSSITPCYSTEENRFLDWPGVEITERPVKVIASQS